MTEDRKKLLEKLKYDKENLIKIKKKYGKEYETLDKKDIKKKPRWFCILTIKHYEINFLDLVNM